MGKKKLRSTQTSKGEHGGSLRTRSSDPALKMINKRKAWDAGKNVVVTIENPNKNETNRPFIRVNASEVWKGRRR